jgi:hypothetical protein
MSRMAAQCSVVVVAVAVEVALAVVRADLAAGLDGPARAALLLAGVAVLVVDPAGSEAIRRQCKR